MLVLPSSNNHTLSLANVVNSATLRLCKVILGFWQMSSSTPYHIVLIEDNPADHHLFQIAVRETGFDVDIEWIKHGEAALAFFESIVTQTRVGARPDLIFMDLNLPRYRGDEILEMLDEKKWLPDSPIVIISSSEIRKEREKTLGMGAAAFLHKPLEIDALIKLIASTLVQFFELKEETPNP